eukprot:6189249-Pleurochrysis_carterae.AAC.2
MTLVQRACKVFFMVRSDWHISLYAAAIDIHQSKDSSFHPALHAGEVRTLNISAQRVSTRTCVKRSDGMHQNDEMWLSLAQPRHE